MRNYTWKMDHHGPLNRQEISENYMNRSHSEDDWMMTKMTRDNDEEGTFPFPCCRAPLKTLQLFPITAPSLKDHHHQGTTTNVQNLSIVKQGSDSVVVVGLWDNVLCVNFLIYVMSLVEMSELSYN